MFVSWNCTCVVKSGKARIKLSKISLQNLKNTQTEILHVIRGKLAASALSAKLGYRFNQAARWESGERRLLWTDFVAICEARRLPLAGQISLYLGYKGNLHDTGPFMKTLLSGKSIDEASKTTGINRSKISRWLSVKAPPTFMDVYMLLRSAVNTLSFFEGILDLSKVPSLASDYRLFQQQRELAYSIPYLDALMEALLLRAYKEAAKHEPEILSAAAGLSIKTVNSALASLAAAGMVEKKSGKYQAAEIGIDYRADKMRMAKMILHWLGETSKAIESLPTKPLSGSLVGFSVFSLSQENHEKAAALFREFNRAIHALGSEDQGPKEKVWVLVNAMMDASHFGPGR
jgi:predicted transcriptional regulator